MKLLFAILFVPCTQALRLTPLSATLNTDIAHVYVINMDGRLDRCQCMESQLLNSKLPFFRQRAATTPDLCPTVNKKAFKQDNQASLFCSHRMIWEKVQKSDNKPPFLIVLEDDVHIPKDFSQKLSAFLSSDCATHEWDVLAVDTFQGHSFAANGKRVGPSDLPADTNGLQCSNRNFIQKNGGFGASTLIVRTESLPKLMALKGHVMDKWTAWGDNKVNVKFWQPQMFYQVSVGPHQQEVPAPQCAKSVWRGGLTHGEFNDKITSGTSSAQAWKGGHATISLAQLGTSLSCV